MSSLRRVIPIVPPAPAGGRGARVGLVSPPPLSLYVHFPWCARKCPYCDFNSHVVRDSIPERRYIDTVLADLERALPSIWGRRPLSVFIGGGTPSLMSVESLERLLDGVRALANPMPGAEITLEANPGSAEAARFAGYRAAGVTRLSLGVQSFDDRSLARIGRIHDGRAAREAVEMALANFERVNLDLMYGLPGQTLDAARADLQTALASGAGHLSCYHLTVEPNTEFHARPPALPDDDLAADMQESIEATLAGAGYQHYETSAFARAGQRCTHNLNYWQFGDYLGIGAGAHGKLSAHDAIRREMRHKHPGAYLDKGGRGDFVQEAHTVAQAELPFEFMMNALRLTEGVAQEFFAALTGLPLARIEGVLAVAADDGLLALSGGRIRATPTGQRFLNDLLQRFLPDRPG